MLTSLSINSKVPALAAIINQHSTFGLLHLPLRRAVRRAEKDYEMSKSPTMRLRESQGDPLVPFVSCDNPHATELMISYRVARTMPPVTEREQHMWISVTTYSSAAAGWQPWLVLRRASPGEKEWSCHEADIRVHACVGDIIL